MVVGWKFRFRYIGVFGRRRLDRPQEVSSMLKYIYYIMNVPMNKNKILVKFSVCNVWVCAVRAPAVKVK